MQYQLPQCVALKVLASYQMESRFRRITCTECVRASSVSEPTHISYSKDILTCVDKYRLYDQNALELLA